MTIKHNIIALACVLASGLLPSCSLDREPSTATTMQLTTIADFENQTQACYQAMRSSSYYGGYMLIVPDIMSDNLMITQGGRGNFRDLFEFEINASSSVPNAFWSSAYNMISQANRLINELEPKKTTFHGSDSIKAIGLLAEAYTVRAMGHFDLVRWFAPRYTDSTSAATIKAIPYVTSNNPLAKPSRNTLREVYQFILNDLIDADNYMFSINDAHNTSINTRFNQQAISGMLSRVYLTLAADGNNEGLLQAALNTALSAIDGKGITDPVSFVQEWHNSFTDANKEVLLRIAILDTDGIPVGNNYGQADASGGFRNDYSINYKLYTNHYLSNNTDCRITAYTRSDAYKGQTYAGVYTYRARTGSPTNVCDGVVMRTPEMYLTIAEAFYRLYELGGPAHYEKEARDFLNHVRKNRYTNYVDDQTTSGQELYDLIMAERRKELAFTGQRFFDLKRLNLTIDRGSYGDLIDGSGNPPKVQSISASDPKTVWPIPQSEIDINPNILN